MIYHSRSLQLLPLPLPLLLVFVLLLSAFVTTAQPVFKNRDAEAWADSVLQNMEYHEKIGQLFMVDAYSNRDSGQVTAITDLITRYHIGGIIFFQGGPVRQALLTNYYQSLSNVKLLIGIDGEWGLSMRLDSTIRFPRQMTLAASGNDSLVYEMAREIGRECRRMGIHLNFAPVADINNNPRNPVINSRSFGEDRSLVTRFSEMYMRGLQDEGVMACGKHFPGHGNTDTDSHLALPVINQSLSEMDTVELVPFRKLINDGIASMMVAHLHIPSMDTATNVAATLSPSIVRKLLREQMGFEGLIFTDALNMKGVANYFQGGDLELKALMAGNDVLLYPADVPKAWMRVHLAVQNCEISQDEIDGRVKRILMAKYWAGLNSWSPVDTTNLNNDLNTPEAFFLAKKMYERSITVIRNENNLLPIRNCLPRTTACLSVNDTLGNPFQVMLGKYAPIEKFRCDRDPAPRIVDSLISLLSQYENVIVSIHNTNTKAETGYGVSGAVNDILTRLKGRVKLITVVFGNAYTLTRMPAALESNSLLISYEDTYWPQYFTAQALFGASMVNGKLPVSPFTTLRAGTGTPLNTKLTRLRFADPLEFGLSASAFSRVDSIAKKAIADKATPGCQVLVAWKGKIIYQKSFGSFTYENPGDKIKNTDLYDIASITKIAATSLGVMKLYEEDEIDPEKKASRYLHALRHTNKKDILVEDILTHQAGLKSWIPFWKNTMENDKPSFNIYHFEKDVNYSVQVCDSLFILNSYEDKIWKELYDSPVENPGKYVYSDLGMLIMQKVIEEITDEKLNDFVRGKFYEPLGLTRLMFNPSGKIPLREIAPTEIDKEFRRRTIRGFVHDPAAAMLGGVAGNAGLFSDSYNLAVIMQMLMNGGEYGGNRYFKKETVDLFTSRYFKNGENRRGLIFDKPEPDGQKGGNTARSASSATFGHTGFTGTAAWADPENELVFIFLSNRVYPDSKVNKLAQGNYRTDMMQAVYDVILNKNTK